MKVLHINGARSWGGNEQQLVDIIPELNKLSIENIIFCVAGSSMHGYCIDNNINFKICLGGQLKNKKNYRFLKKIVEENKIDILHLHTSDSVTLYVISDILYSLNMKTVFSKKGISNSMSFLSLFKYNYKGIDCIICVSNKVKEVLQEKVIKQKNHHKLKVIYDGININRANQKEPKFQLREKLNIPESDNLIINIANHAKAKDLPTLLKAISFLVYELDYKKFHLVQIGKESKLTDELIDLINDLNIKQYVTFLGFVENASAYLSQCDLYVMSSEREGLPLTIYEAFYRKIPVVSTKAGGIPEIITDQENGMLVEIGEYKGLANKIVTLIRDESLSQKFRKESSQKFLNKFTADITALKFQNEYKKLLNN